MNDGDFIVSVHALERFQERFPTLWENDPDTGKMIYDECQDALEHRRTGSVPPLELAHHDLDRWQAGKSFYAWTPNKQRGYVLKEDSEGDLTVVTVLRGKSTEDARKMLYQGRRPKKETDEDSRNEQVAS